MITSPVGTTSTSTSTGTVVVDVSAPTAVVAQLRVHDANGRLVARRRVHDQRVSLTLRPGTYLVTADDLRSIHDPRRLAGSSVHVEVTAGGVVETALSLTRGSVVRATVTRDAAPTRFARVALADAGGHRLEVRTDGHGQVVLAGLDAGTWTLTARDSRGDHCSDAVTATLAPDVASDVALDLSTETCRLLVRVRGTDRRPVRAGEVSLVDDSGRRVTVPLRDGVADARGLRPGPVTLVVPPSVGHLGGRATLGPVEPGTLTSCDAVVKIGASITGRVVQGAQQYAAVVALLDADGVEVERVRTDELGRFELGRGLRTTAGLAVVATTGPETLHVTRAACADVDVVTGVRHDVGDIALPVAGRPARWTAVATPVAPSTRV